MVNTQTDIETPTTTNTIPHTGNRLESYVILKLSLQLGLVLVEIYLGKEFQNDFQFLLRTLSGWCIIHMLIVDNKGCWQQGDNALYNSSLHTDHPYDGMEMLDKIQDWDIEVSRRM